MEVTISKKMRDHNNSIITSPNVFSPTDIFPFTREEKEKLASLENCDCTGSTVNLNSQISIPNETSAYTTKLFKDILDVLITNKDKKINTNLTWSSIGDSITWYDTNHTSLMTKGYQSYVKDKLVFNQHLNVVWNGGSWLHFAEEPTLVPVTSSDLYTVMLGINDFARNLEVGTIDDYVNNNGSGTLYGCIKLYTDYLKSINPNAIIALCTPNYAYGFNNLLPNANTPNNNGNTLLDFVTAIRDVCSYDNYGLIDVYLNSGFNWNNAKSLCIDIALHPNNIGMSMISDVFVEYIKTLLTTLIIDYINKKVGIGVSPSAKLDVDGAIGNNVNGINGVVSRVSGKDGSRVAHMIHNKTTTPGVSRQSVVEFSSDIIKQSFGIDLYQDGTNTFFLFDRINAIIRLVIDASHNWDVNGELTAKKLKIKDGTSTNILMADGSVTSLSTLNVNNYPKLQNNGNPNTANKQVIETLVGIGFSLNNANLVGVDLEFSNLSYSDLRNTNLTGANLVSMDLSFANLTGSNLENANLNLSDLTGVDLTNTILLNASFEGVQGLDSDINIYASVINTDPNSDGMPWSLTWIDSNVYTWNPEYSTFEQL